ncbi:MAG: secretin N-terminal domain-containing protein [Nitrospirota bacterium]
MKLFKLSAVLCSIFLVLLSSSYTSYAANDHIRMPERSSARITFNFVDVEISTIVKFISEITGNNFLFDERIKGKITIIAPTKLSIDESFTLFTSVLNLKGFTIIPSGPRTYKIIPSSLAKQEGILSPDETVPLNEGYITKLVPLENIKADEAVQFLRPVISRDGHISSFGPRNMLLVVDAAINIDKMISLLKLIDVPAAAEEEAGIHVYFLEYADATELSKVLQGIIKDFQTGYKTGLRASPKNVSPETPPILSVTPDKATNSLVVVAPYSDYRNIVQVIRTLDRKRKQVFVEAMIVEASIDDLRDLGSKWRAIAKDAKGAPIAVGGVGNVGADTLLNIINGLSGISIGGMGNFFDVPITSISTSGSVSSQTLTAPGFAALFSLSEFRDAINVLSTPQILTSDNQEAEILVGENVPFISQRERDATTATTVLNSITRTDVGIKLQITPQITEGDYVKLDIFQEISSVKSASDVILTTVGPTTTKRSTKTSVLVKDGRTVVIGGLMQEKDEESVTKVPLLGDIPLIGWLFKFKSVSSKKTNLLVFLSPHVVKETSELAQLTEKKHKEFVTKEKLYLKGELLVKFKEDVSMDRAQEIISLQQASVIRYFESINVYQVKLKSGRSVDDAINDFLTYREVLYAEPNYKVKLQVPPPDIETDGPGPDINIFKKEDTSREGKAFPPAIADTGNNARDFDINTPPRITGEGDTAPAADTDKKKITPEPLPDIPQNTDGTTGPPADEVPVNNTEKPESFVPPLQIQPSEESYSPVSDDKQDLPEEAQPVTSPGNSDSIRDASGSSRHFIQIGAWINLKYAQEALGRLKASYPDIYLIKEGSFNKVRIPGTADKKKDAFMLKELQEKYNLKPILVYNKS